MANCLFSVVRILQNNELDFQCLNFLSHIGKAAHIKIEEKGEIVSEQLPVYWCWTIYCKANETKSLKVVSDVSPLGEMDSQPLSHPNMCSELAAGLAGFPCLVLPNVLFVTPTVFLAHWKEYEACGSAFVNKGVFFILFLLFCFNIVPFLRFSVEACNTF